MEIFTMKDWKEGKRWKKGTIVEEAIYEVDMKKSQLELYLEEKKEDRRRELDVINFWRVSLFKSCSHDSRYLERSNFHHGIGIHF